MIIEAGFTAGMIDMLKTMKGKVFKSYECVDPGNFGTFASCFRVNLGRSSIDVVCDYHPLEGDPAGFDEPTWFSCFPAGSDDEIGRYLDAHSHEYLVDESIVGVELVRDEVDYPNDQVVMRMDMALVIRTKYHTFTFAHDVWFSDILSVATSDADSEPAGIYSVEKLWLEEDESAKVTRSTIML